MIGRLVISFLLTLSVEGIYGYLWGLRGKDLYLLFLVNLLTNPAVVLINALTGAVFLPELAAIVVEGGLYRSLGEKVKYPWLFSLSVNVFSYSLGCVIQWFL